MSYRTFKRSCTDWKSFASARKIKDMSGLTHEEAYNRCQLLNSELTTAQKRSGTKYEFESY